MTAPSKEGVCSKEVKQETGCLEKTNVPTMLWVVFIWHERHEVVIVVVLHYDRSVFGWRSERISPASFDFIIKSLPLRLFRSACKLIGCERAMRATRHNVAVVIQNPMAHLVTLPIRWSQSASQLHFVPWKLGKIPIVNPLIPTIRR